MIGRRRPHLLIVEDNLGDVELFKMFVSSHSSAIDLSFARTALEFTKFMHGCLEERGGNEIPDLVLLDLNLPNRDGRELLREIKSTPEFCSIPVVMMSSSRNPDEVSNAYRLGANAFITKPVEIDAYERSFISTISFWLEQNERSD